MGADLDDVALSFGSLSSTVSGSTGNAAGITGFCTKNNYLSGTTSFPVKNQLLRKSNGSKSKRAENDPDYIKGAKGIVTDNGDRRWIWACAPEGCGGLRRNAKQYSNKASRCCDSHACLCAARDCRAFPGYVKQATLSLPISRSFFSCSDDGEVPGAFPFFPHLSPQRSRRAVREAAPLPRPRFGACDALFN
jgi:hypothetical protein